MSSPVIRSTLATLEFDLMHFSWYNLFLFELVCGNFQADPPKCLCQSVTTMFEKALGSHP
jgi:hypothetical protein